MAKKTILGSWFQTTTIRITRVHFMYIAAYIASIIIFDSWNLYTHEAVSELWTAAGILLAINTIIWYTARMKFSKDTVYKFLALVLILADVVFAAYNVYWQHGLASKSVMLFAIPIVIAAVVRSRSTVLATAALCAAAYSTISVRYFYQNYGGGYRVELWGTIGFYCAIFFVLAALLLIIIKPTQEKL